MSRVFCARTRNCRSARSVALDAAWFGLVMPTFLPGTISHCYRGSLVARRKVLPLRGFRSFLGFPIRAVQLANLPRCLGRHAFGAAGVDRGAAHPIAQGLRVAPSLAETAFIPPKCVGTIPGGSSAGATWSRSFPSIRAYGWTGNAEAGSAKRRHLATEARSKVQPE